MARALDVLVVESDRRAAGDAARALIEAGHRVHRCVEVDAPAFPCRGVDEPAACPLEQPIDVVLDVRGHPWPTPTGGEAGAACALRRRVPLVVAGKTALQPFGERVRALVDDRDPGAIVAVCEGVADEPLPVHSDLARAALEIALAPGGSDPGPFEAAVHRRGSGLHARLTVPPGLPIQRRDALVTRVHLALRGHDRAATEIEIAVVEADRAMPS